MAERYEEADTCSDVEAMDRAQDAALPAYLTIDGKVAHTMRLLPEDVTEVPRTSCVDVLHCDHRGDAGPQTWRGVSLTALLQLAQPQPDARYVRVHAQDYCVPLALDEIADAVLVESIDGEPLSQTRGAPWRLFIPGSQCHVNVKWVERLEVSATRGATAAERATRARQRGRIAGQEVSA